MLKADIDRMRGLGWHVAPLVALCLLGLCTAGCWSRKVVVEESPPDVVLLTDHVRIVSPGDEVPALPDGETRWWLCTPTGMRHLLPADAPVNKVGDGQ